MVQIDAAINPGASGGPVLTSDGRVIGIVDASLRGAQSFNFAVPIDLAKPLVQRAATLGPLPLPLTSSKELTAPKLAELGFFGASLEGYGCAGMSNVEYGLIMQELERGDSGLRSFVSVQGALVMYPIKEYGSEEQKERWLPALQQGKAIGCFGLTEPDFGSNPAGMRARAVKDGDQYILNGEKAWIKFKNQL
jgi:alkylation response protein AidB-like acyl-CoA dehydrogenase